LKINRFREKAIARLSNVRLSGTFRLETQPIKIGVFYIVQVLWFPVSVVLHV